jgi:hypothetical protein
MELFLNSEEYKLLKKQYERTCFKLVGEYCIHTGDKFITKSAQQISEYFKNKNITIEIIEEQTTKKGVSSTRKQFTKNFYQIWSEDPDMKEYLEIVFNCDIKKVKPTQYNLFENFTHLDDIKIENEAKINLKPMFEHIRSMVNYNKSHFKYVISWLAQIVQQPHILPHTCIIFISEEGIGKDFFCRFISDVLNDNYCFNTDKLESICGKFNSILGGKLLITINETNPIESRDRIDNIKYLITANKIIIEGKHKDPIKSENFSRFMFFSNRLFAFPIEEGSRRPVLIKSSSKYLPKNYGVDKANEHFTDLDNFIQDKRNQKAFLDYLKKYDITKFNPRDFEKSELHKELEDASISQLAWFLKTIANTNIEELRYTVSEAYNKYKKYLDKEGYKYEITSKAFRIELTQNYKGITYKKKADNNYFYFNTNEIREYLKAKYKMVFDTTQTEINYNVDDLPKIDLYKEKYEDAQQEINKLKEELEQIKKSLKLNKKLEIVKKPIVNKKSYSILESDDEDDDEDDDDDDEDDDEDEDDEDDNDDRLNVNEIDKLF